jgi:hypothetical protein
MQFIAPGFLQLTFTLIGSSLTKLSSSTTKGCPTRDANALAAVTSLATLGTLLILTQHVFRTEEVAGSKEDLEIFTLNLEA